MCSANQNKYEERGDLQCLIDKIESEKFDTKFFTPSDAQTSMAWGIIMAAREIGRKRLSENEKYNPDWFGELSDYQVLCFATFPGVDLYADLLHPLDTEVSDERWALPGVTPAAVAKRKARVLAVLKAQLAAPSP